MKILMMLLVFSFMIIPCFALESKAIINQGKVLLTFPTSPNFTYSILRRSENTDYEVIESNKKLNGNYVDSSIEPNTQYYYIVAANSAEIKLDVATELLKVFDLGPKTDLEYYMPRNATRNSNSIVVRGTNMVPTYQFQTGMTFDSSKKYVAKVHIGEMSGRGMESGIGSGYFFLSVGLVPCGRQGFDFFYLKEHANSVYECEIDPSLGTVPLEKKFNDSIVRIGVGNDGASLEVKKIEIFGFAR